MRVSHKTSLPANQQQTPTGFNQSSAVVALQGRGRKNSRPVRVTNHQWPPGIDFRTQMPKLQMNNPNMNFNFHNNAFPFPREDSMQRFYQPEYDPHSGINLHPGLRKFFDSIESYGPQNGVSPGLKQLEDGKLSQADPNEAAIIIPSQEESVLAPKVEYPSDNESVTSSIRSSASAYWPPELRFPTGKTDDEVDSWKFHKPMMQLRRKSPDHRKRQITRY